MNREELMNLVESIHDRHMVLELATGFGKTRCALAKVNEWSSSGPVLIAVPKLVLINSWIDEFNKWGYQDLLASVTFTTYASFHKHAGKWGVVVLDEGHHLSERCQGLLKQYEFKHLIVLSATLPVHIKQFLRDNYSPRWVRASTKEAIDSNVLSDPTVLLMPLKLDAQNKYLTIEVGKKHGKGIQHVSFNRLNDYKYSHVICQCTESEYYTWISGQVDRLKTLYMAGNHMMKNAWLKKAGDRLKWLSNLKTAVIKRIINMLGVERTIVFCPSIKASEELNIPCINSKVGLHSLADFNEGNINMVATVAMLDEGFNPVDCRVGLFQMINASTKLNVQRQGRIFRHDKPLFIIPYYTDTREAEIVKKVTEGFDVHVISISDIKKFINKK